jgi:hypothetical protein
VQVDLTSASYFANLFKESRILGISDSVDDGQIAGPRGHALGKCANRWDSDSGCDQQNTFASSALFGKDSVWAFEHHSSAGFDALQQSSVIASSTDSEANEV